MVYSVVSTRQPVRYVQWRLPYARISPAVTERNARYRVVTECTLQPFGRHMLLWSLRGLDCWLYQFRSESPVQRHIKSNGFVGVNPFKSPFSGLSARREN